jgi:PAS domain S-box-containing protein
MASPLRILLLEDDLGDAQLIGDLLEEESFHCKITRVQTRSEFVAALEEEVTDLILADYRLPAFDGLSALKLVLEIRPDLPFIFVSGLLGEEIAIEALKIGATDYVLKTGLSRLIPAVKRALREADEKRERKKAEEAMRLAEEIARQSDRELRGLIENIPAMLFIALPGASNAFVSRRWREYTGLSEAETAGSGWEQVVHPEDIDRHLAKWHATSARGEPFEDQARFRRASDGEYRTFLVRAIPMRDAAGNVLKWYGVATDIEDRKRAEESLRRSQGHLSEAQRLSVTGSFSWRVATDEITWSEQLYRIYEFETGVPVTLELIRTRVHPEDISLLEKMKMVHQEGGGDAFEWQYRLLMPDCSIKYMHAVAHATRDQDGHLEYTAAVQDVTQRRLSEEALAKARSELAHIARVTSLSTLTASIAHEVNQPLSGIMTNASTCLRMLSAEPPNLDGARATVQRMLRDGNRASEVIHRLRAMFARRGPTAERVDLNEATREVLALSSSELQANRVILRTDFDDRLPAVEGDRVQLQQVILNLVLNAADAMRAVDDRPRNLLIATATEDATGVRLSVRDSGVGIDPQSLGKLFDAFYTTKSDGMGIGLAISRSIIESHEGRLWATPNDGAGATFTFSIPCATAPAPALEAAVAPPGWRQ